MAASTDGLDFGDAVTLVKPTARERLESLHAPLQPRIDTRYEEERVLGLGGAGIVKLQRDTQIGRRVAMKLLRKDRAVSPELERRFIREARLQGQLEHPSVVPVYDLGVTPAGDTYFTMKRIRGVTLATIIDKQARGSRSFAEQFPRRRLLSAFSQVCLAVDFAHQHGVIHRDLKPENIMLGDYGEVYVLDWGVAKITGAAGTAEPDEDEDVADAVIDVESLAPTETVVGGLTGTLGFICPEQIRSPGAKPAVAWDIYALGSVLFELLTLLPLHNWTKRQDILRSTVAGADARASVRAPYQEIPPELDAICVKATALEPGDRYAGARELHHAVERFLSGERDVQLRQELAQAHALKAAQAARQGGLAAGGEIEARRRAMQEVGRALALDPDNQQAMLTLVQLLTVPPEELPDEVVDELDRSERRKTRWVSKSSAIAYGSLLLYLPLMLWQGVRDPLPVVLFYAAAAVAVGVSVWVARRPQPTAKAPLAVMLASNLAFAFSSAFWGAFLITPMMIIVNTVGYVALVRRRYRPFVIAVACVMMAVPILLEVTGVAQSYQFTAQGMLVVPRAFELPQVPVLVIMSLSCLGAIFIGTLSVAHIRDALEHAERTLYLYTWHLRELVPASAGSVTDPITSLRGDRLPSRPPPGGL